MVDAVKSSLTKSFAFKVVLATFLPLTAGILTFLSLSTCLLPLSVCFVRPPGSLF